MRMIGLFLGALLVSINCFASSTTPGNELHSAILKNLSKQSSSYASNPSIIYGGQDISRHEIATANESLWSGQETYPG